MSMRTNVKSRLSVSAGKSAEKATVATSHRAKRKSHSAGEEDRKTAIGLLKSIPADLAYQDWFRVAAALKNAGVPFEEFDRWSRTAAEKYDQAAAERVWDSACAEDKPEVTLGSLQFIAGKYSPSLPVPVSKEMLGAPSCQEDQARQIAAFLELMFRAGEYFELVTEVGTNGKGKKFPKRTGVICSRGESEFTEESLNEHSELAASCTEGAWISLNPVRHELKGSVPADTDVIDFRHALIEADELSRDEQWGKLLELNLPILAVVWSGGKSLHAIVKIDAGCDIDLYRKRVADLYRYLEEKGFPVDGANKNPSRLTRLAGICRGADMQYVVSMERGPRDWAAFERSFLSPAEETKSDLRSQTSPENGKKGGRPFMPVTEYADAFLKKYSPGSASYLHYWDGQWWQYSNGFWSSLSEEDLVIRVTRFLQELSVQSEGRISNALIVDTIANLKGLCGLTGINVPCWLSTEEDASNMSCFANGLVDVRGLIAGSGVELRPHTPEYFGLDHVDYAYDPGSDCPQWREYLATTFNDEESRRALQMMFGYILSGKTDKNIGFFLVGRGGDGKSVAAHVLRKLVGESQTCCLPFANLGDRFSSYLLADHKLNLVEELPVTAEMRNMADAEKVFKMVTDGSFIPVERKFHSPQEKRARARCVFLANELPAFIDRSNGLWDRLVVLPFLNRFRDTSSEKANLKYDLEAELPGIFNWAMEGARALNSLKRFPIPGVAGAYIEKHRLACDHETAFLRESVMVKPDGFCPKRELYFTYRQWVEDHGYRPLGMDRFNAAVKTVFPDVLEKRQRTPFDRMVWQGISFGFDGDNND